jgi:hypothetical protein
MRITDYAQLARRLGTRSIVFNAIHRARIKSGWYERSQSPRDRQLLPDDIVERAVSPYDAPRDGIWQPDDGYLDQLRSEASEICAGRFLYFSHYRLASPSSWRVHPRTGVHSPLVHWSRLDHFDSQRGDIKWYWEASRFDWAYTLGRAWHYLRDEQAARAFWELLEDWVADNPPFLGVNWMCGQECSFRLIALTWTVGVIRDASATTPSRQRLLWSVVAWLARRVNLSFIYALSQNNNHGLSEAAALYVAGTSLPDLPESHAWTALGRKWFARAVSEQFADDGLYIQKSFNYTRLALRVAGVYLTVAARHGQEVALPIRQRLLAAVRLLDAVTDENSGAAPNFGGNDGANIMQLSSAPYLDFRPVVQSLTYILTGRKRYGDGSAVAEEFAWAQASTIPAPNAPETELPRVAAGVSGYSVLRGIGTRIGIHCKSHRSRPAHADTLHLDFWRGPVNVARDCGTYSYADRSGWAETLAGSAGHNVVLVDGSDQMRRFSRFLWLDWPKARIRSYRSWEISGVPAQEWCGEHYGYRSRGVVHRRTVHGRGDDWLIIDDLIFEAIQRHSLTVLWHLDPAIAWTPAIAGVSSPDLDVLLYGPRDIAIERISGASHLPGNGESLYYDEIHPVFLLSAECRAESSTRMITSFGRQHPVEEAGDIRWFDLRVSRQI